MQKPFNVSLAASLIAGACSLQAAEFLRLVPVVPKISASAVAYPGGSYEVANLLDGNPRTEYSSNGRGTNTFVEFDFGATVPIAAFRHQDRNDPATVSSSALVFLDDQGAVVASKPVLHANQRGAITSCTLPDPVSARRVRWQITGLGRDKHGTVGGAEIAFYTPAEKQPAPLSIGMEVRALPILERKGASVSQPLVVTLDYPYSASSSAVLRVDGAESTPLSLGFGSQQTQISISPATKSSSLKIDVEVAGQVVATKTVTLQPPRQLDIFLLPHSHVDIGYTELQADVEKKQNSNIQSAMRLIDASKDFPEGSRFKWNVEVLWPVENYLRDAAPDKRAAFLSAVKTGQVGLDAMYGNILTGLCRPEELVRLMSYATRLSTLCGVPVESAMISDVPGYTWSTVPALAHAGVKYFSFAPNYFDRMGGTMVTWQNKPFWWKGPDGRSRILCWCPSRGYALGHLIGDGEALARFLPDYLNELQTNGYPYDITHLRWNVHGDNGSPDEKLAQVVRDWNARHASPRLIIATTAEAFRAFERKYGPSLPEFSGDYTPYWEDGAASSALETAVNRASAERLVQAETLWALRGVGSFPAAAFQEAWRNILLYSEHTWGAHNSISQPDLPFVRDQWKVKQAFALDADKQSRALLAQAFGQSRIDPSSAAPAENLEAVDVFNTTSWSRTDLAVIPAGVPADAGVLDDKGAPVLCQPLPGGGILFLAREVPAFSSRRFRLTKASPPLGARVKAEGCTLSHPDFTLRIDPDSGAIASFYSHALKQELVDPKAAAKLNDYFYLPGSNLEKLQRNGPPRIAVKENGPLAASLVIESDAPGCRKLTREVRVVDGLDRVEIADLIDKKPVREKEGIHIGFGLNVPDGVVRMDVGWAVVRPEADQMPASCKNWFSVQRWVDVSNDRFGLTIAPIDAPLVQVGGITANLVGSQTDHRVWIQHLDPSQTLYWWVMNNHWHTNYRADQEGPALFRFLLRPHRGFAPESAARFGAACSQPLLVGRAGDTTAPPRFGLSSQGVLVTALKPSDDGKAWIMRLFGASGTNERVRISWPDPSPAQLWLSDTSERPLRKLDGNIDVPAWGILTLRADRR